MPSNRNFMPITYSGVAFHMYSHLPVYILAVYCYCFSPAAGDFYSTSIKK